MNRRAPQRGYAIPLRPMTGHSVKRRFGDPLVHDLHELWQVEPAHLFHENPGGRIFGIESVAGPARRHLVRGHQPAVEHLGLLSIGEARNDGKSRPVIQFAANYELALQARGQVTHSRTSINDEPSPSVSWRREP